MWLYIVILAHMLNAGTFLVNKFLLIKAVPKPIAYTFWIAMMGGVAVLLLPFGYVQPSIGGLGLAFIAGATFDLALLSFFAALRWLETSRVVPFVGGVQPLLILLFAFTMLGERLSQNQIIAVALLVIGTAFISIDTSDATPAEAVQKHRGWMYAICATIFFAITYTVTKAVFDTQPFISGFVWIRIGSLVFALLFLLRSSWRRSILAKQERPQGRYGALFVGSQIIGAIAAILLQYGISLASVTIVTALQGLQYAFLFVLAVVLGKKFAPLRERLSPMIITRKLAAIVLIGAGLVLIV